MGGKHICKSINSPACQWGRCTIQQSLDATTRHSEFMFTKVKQCSWMKTETAWRCKRLNDVYKRMWLWHCDIWWLHSMMAGTGWWISSRHDLLSCTSTCNLSCSCYKCIHTGGYVRCQLTIVPGMSHITVFNILRNILSMHTAASGWGPSPKSRSCIFTCTIPVLAILL